MEFILQWNSKMLVSKMCYKVLESIGNIVHVVQLTKTISEHSLDGSYNSYNSPFTNYHNNNNR